LKFIRINYLSYIYERYNVECKDKSIEEIIDEIAKKRGFIVKGGEIDYERTYNAIIDDYRKNKLGKIAFEIPTIE
jgi:ribosome biogenesis GTPase A